MNCSTILSSQLIRKKTIIVLLFILDSSRNSYHCWRDHGNDGAGYRPTAAAARWKDGTPTLHPAARVRLPAAARSTSQVHPAVQPLRYRISRRIKSLRSAPKLRQPRLHTARKCITV